MHRVKSWGNQVQSSNGPLPGEPHITCLISPATSCDNTFEMLSTREAHQRRKYLEFLLGASHVATLCLANTKIVDSQKESSINCIVHTVVSNTQQLGQQEPLTERDSQTPAKGQPCKQAISRTEFQASCVNSSLQSLPLWSLSKLSLQQSCYR